MVENFSHPPGLTGVVTVTVTASDIATNVVSKVLTYQIDTKVATYKYDYSNHTRWYFTQTMIRILQTPTQSV